MCQILRVDWFDVICVNRHQVVIAHFLEIKIVESLW